MVRTRIFAWTGRAGKLWTPRSRKWLLRIGAGLAALILAAAGGGYFWLKASLPALDGTVRLAGITAPVDIVRDRHGIPHIRAANESDAMFALGFVHAQDRLFQMEFSRLLGQGRLSEVIGAETVEIDRLIRTFDIPGLAEAALARLPPGARRAVESYSRGINEYLATRHGLLPAEFQALRHAPARWRPADTLLWGRLMAFRLSGDWRREAFRAALAEKLSPERIAELWPDPVTRAPPTTSSAANRRAAGKMLAGILNLFPTEMEPLTASNSWGLAGSRTATGKPILANDPHLGFRAPGLWYLARIDAPGLTLAGGTVPGVPFVMLGHNGSVAWAFTTLEGDTQDLFIEEQNPDNEGEYRTPDGWRAFETRDEIIRVRGAAPVTVTVRRSRHGPVISDLLPDLAKQHAGSAIALSAAALRRDDDTAEAMYLFNRATDAGKFLAALEKFHAPPQNITFADTAGTLGFMTAGKIPVRRSGRGTHPSPGGDGAADWTGYIPFSELPRTINPPGGTIVNANHEVAPPGYRHFLGYSATAPYRALRIHELLSRTEIARHTTGRSAEMQQDSISLMARDLVPLLTAHPGTDPRLRGIARRVAAWDGEMDRNRPEPLIFMAWLRALNQRLFADEIGPLFGRFWALRPVLVKRVLTGTGEWCDDMATEKIRESCASRIAAALKDAVDQLSDRYGSDPSAWRWGAAHVARFHHPVLGRIPLIRGLANIGIASDGGPFTVNRAQPHVANRRQPYASVHGPGYRAIYDLAALDRSRFMIATGQSGNPLSPHYGDLMEKWRDGKYVRLLRRPEDPMGTLRIMPR